ncbi:hypothetical protein DAPPUDRAFT_238577 [Daphnia pulex]|uniref:Uncharacterized protein n=1 Tax=Daphnia pulex TaxID=6669 RepID=E9G832_DAPPU|nr:hypothetical protein DAPPUDRAFT_238577 [Daphnia pulex]|eukprot:EFX84755.1 hypothetical protein DAPPUDRAFT_238577 [Daphnia pulex]
MKHLRLHTEGGRTRRGDQEGRDSADIRLVAALSEEWYLLVPEGAYKGPDGLGSTQRWAEITTTPSARLSLGSA